MKMEVTLDTGPVFRCLKTQIDAADTTGVLHDRLADLGATALIQCIELAQKGELVEPQVQDEANTTYAHKLSKAEAQLDWNETAKSLALKVRAFNPWPVTWCELGGQRIRVWQAKAVSEDRDYPPGEILIGWRSLRIGTASGLLELLVLQRAGGQKMAVGDFLNANNIKANG